MAGPKIKGSRAYREGYKRGSRKTPFIYNPFTKSGKRKLKTEFEASGGWKQFVSDYLLSEKEAKRQKLILKQSTKGRKVGAKEYYAKKKKDSSVKLAKKYFRGGMV
jgi:hypothetical protein